MHDADSSDDDSDDAKVVLMSAKDKRSVPALIARPAADSDP